MTVTIQPGSASGIVQAIGSKSVAHRQLICAALADKPTHVFCENQSQDIAATVRCLQSLGASIWHEGGAYRVVPIHRERIPQPCTLNCGESGSTLRFLVPVVCALGVTATFQMAGRLAQRPMEPLATQLREHGCTITHDPVAGQMVVSGQLKSGTFTIPGNVSSQFITGLLFALPLLGGESSLVVEGELESRAYVDLTLSALQTFGITPPQSGGAWTISPAVFRSPGTLRVEGDWSNAAPWLCMGVLGGEGVTVEGMDPNSLQGDKAVCDILARMGGQVRGTTARPGTLTPTTIDARNIPDLVPVLSAVAAAIPGQTQVTGAARLRLKESDRLTTTAQTLNALGGDVEETQEGLIIRGRARLAGGTVDAQGDHRIVMLAAVASVVCAGPVTITGAEAIRKSYPTFWDDLRGLGKEVVEG
ncbi:MAG: 3-phosphoshikimate 1-carboxyvinyltransferase [Ruminiclostridium sp.]|nr:3-phosphoshikimate 1-carboxyvinyltransferase [Ruminiclostridium sp.]